jgi:hypothetical protein
MAPNKPEKNKTGKPRPVPDDIAAKQVDKSVSGYGNALGRTTKRLVPYPAPPGRESPRKSARGRRDGCT